jgi:hypothetical protein
LVVLRDNGALSTSLPREEGVALDTELFVSPKVPRVLCRELPLGKVCTERKLKVPVSRASGSRQKAANAVVIAREIKTMER